MRHEPAALKRMNKVCPSVIAKDGGRVAGYVIMMPRDWVVHFPVLLPMLHKLYAMSRHGVSLLENKRWCSHHACHIHTGFQSIVKPLNASTYQGEVRDLSTP